MSGSTSVKGSSSHFRHLTLYSTRVSVLPSIRRWAHSWRQCQKDGQRLETGRGPMIVSSAPHVGIGRGASPNKLQTEEASRGAQQRRGTQMCSSSLVAPTPTRPTWPPPALKEGP